MGAGISGASGNSREFIKFTVDGKVIKGNSKVSKYSDYFEGGCPIAFQAFAGHDGTVFDWVNLKLRVTKQAQNILEEFFKRGEKLIEIEVLRRESTKSGSDYQSFKVIYNGCRLYNISLAHNSDSALWLDMSFIPEDSVSIEMNIPSADGKSTEKVGPITYSLSKEELV
ncbi:type VI secretion protein [Escherichia coli]|uniref:hypothetical protein n=1 Tax=Escherichia coli TaxID=562 RepID=UPI00079FE24F|nr:hypothetical protein [Escherichia coli]EEQ3932022.1 type VI secretion protein [Escherichia coli]EEQ9667624.1 type VI secretion protein [Escherichia coli]EEW0065134.1 type VI secretion protein [Escherichia coli]EFA1709428.1 type VI secretion protein [Escherichia coli]EFC7121823.1 type VI secretion protein [Escherichia coli]